MKERIRQEEVVQSDYVQLFSNYLAEQQIVYIMSFGSLLDLERLNAAVNNLIKDYPFLSSKIEQVDEKFVRTYCEKTVIIDRNDIVELEKFVLEKNDPFQCDTLKVGLFSDGLRDTMCIKFDHTITDGYGAKLICHNIAENYRNNCANKSIFRKQVPLGLVKTEGRESKQPAPVFMPMKFDFRRNEKFWINKKINPVHFSKIQNVCHKYETTINDVLLASLYYALEDTFDIVDEIELPVMVPVDLRSFIGSDYKKSIGNMTSTVFVQLKIRKDEKIEERLKKVHDVMNGFKSDYEGLLSNYYSSIKIAQKPVEQNVDYYSKISRGGSGFYALTNFGIMNQEVFNFDDNIDILDIQILGPFQFPSGALFSVSTYKSQLNLNVVSFDRESYCKYLDKIVDGMEKYIIAIGNL